MMMMMMMIMMMMCYCVLYLLKYFVHWNCCEDLFSVLADRNGMAAPSFLAAAGACAILLRFAAESPKWHCDDSVRRVKGALPAAFSDSGSDAFP